VFLSAFVYVNVGHLKVNKPFSMCTNIIYMLTTFI